jgi:signal transduction histidine kinase
MIKNIYKNAINILPGFFDSQLQLDVDGAGVFRTLKKIIDFEEGYIFFLNPENIILKYQFGKDGALLIDDVFPIDEGMKPNLFSTSSMIIKEDDSLIKLLNLPQKCSFLISKLSMRNTVYGFILLSKSEPNFYNVDDVEVMTTVSSVISYNIKDLELSDVFKFQLKALTASVLQVRESEKVKTEFLANISHELRTPLNSIIGFSEILANGFYGALNEKQSEFVRDINVSGLHLMGMINEILDISKIEAHAMNLNKSEFLISLAVNEVVNVLKPLADIKLVKIVKNIEKDVDIYADFQKIKQILYNLLSNAIKFSPEKDSIYVNVLFENNNLILEVKDNGVGIAPENHQKIFEKFVQLENAYTKKESSTGLGLTITKELTHLLGGKIIVRSDVGEGAMFIITIPLK